MALLTTDNYPVGPLDHCNDHPRTNNAPGYATQRIK